MDTTNYTDNSRQGQGYQEQDRENPKSTSSAIVQNDEKRWSDRESEIGTSMAPNEDGSSDQGYESAETSDTSSYYNSQREDDSATEDSRFNADSGTDNKSNNTSDWNGNREDSNNLNSREAFDTEDSSQRM